MRPFGSTVRAWSAFAAALLGVVVMPSALSGRAVSAPSHPAEIATNTSDVAGHTGTLEANGNRPHAPPAPATGPSGDSALATTSRTVLDAVDRARKSGFSRVDFLIAAVPDPIDSAFAEDFDTHVAAIRLALEAGGYVSNVFVDPWAIDTEPSDNHVDPAQHRDRHRTEPGALLFRRTRDANGTTIRELFVVLLVGESPTWGVQTAALLRALDLINGICGPSILHRDAAARAFCGTRTDRSWSSLIRLLGPSASGAAESLRATVALWLADQISPQPLAFPPKWRFEICSGSATSRSALRTLQNDLPEEIQSLTGWSVPIKFGATINPDDRLWNFASTYLQTVLRAPAEEIALLTESNTGYGQEFPTNDRRPRTHETKAPSPDSAYNSPMTLAFPLNISQVRQRRGTADDSSAGLALVLPHHFLSLDDRSTYRHTDTIGPHSGLTTNATDLALKNLLHTIATEPIHYVGILASDVLDGIFLAEQVHQEFPQVVIIFLTSNLLYLHEELTFLNGALVASTYPLGEWTKRMSFPFAGDRLRLLFSSEYAQGTYNAVLSLTSDLQTDDIYALNDFLDYSPPFVNPLAGNPNARFGPPLWMSVIEGGEFWPLQTRSVGSEGTAGYVQTVKMVSAASTVLEQDRCQAWTPPDFGNFEWLCALLALISLSVGRSYWSSRRKGRACPVLSGKIGDLMAPATGFPHRGMHRFAFFATFITMGLVETLACIPLTVHTFMAIVSGGRLFGRLTLCLLFAAAMIATGAAIFWTFIDWIGYGIRVGVVATRACHGPRRHVFSMLARATRRALHLGPFYLFLSAMVFTVAIFIAVHWMNINHVGRFNPSDAGVELVLLALRTRALGGASLIGATGLLGLAMLVWILAHLRQVRLHQNASPLRQWGILPPYGRARELFDEFRLAAPIDGLLAHVESVWPSGPAMIWLLIFNIFGYVCARRVVVFDHLWWDADQVLPFLFTGLLSLLAWGCGRALGSWRELQRVLAIAALTPAARALEQVPRRLLESFRRSESGATELVWRGYFLQLGQHLALRSVHRQLSTSTLFGIIGEHEVDGVRLAWGAIVPGESWRGGARREIWMELVALRMSAFIGYARAHIFNSLGTVTAATLPLLWLTSMYPFQSSRILLALALVLVMASVAITLFILTQMNRNELLSHVDGTAPGLTWDWPFISGLLVHGALPLVALVSVKFPALGRPISGWLLALVHGLGTG
jgi:hypothetical protein